MTIHVLALFVSVFTFGISPTAIADTETVKPEVLNAKARIIDIDHGSGTVDFEAIGRPGALKIHGKGAAPHGSFKIVGSEVTGNLTFDLESLDTGMKLRNEHMKKKYLETEKFPQAKLSITKMNLPKDFTLDNCNLEKATFEGILTLHGVDKPVTGESKIDCKSGRVNFDAHFDLVIENFGITIPSFAGVTMAKDVKVSVAASAPVISNK
jgi:polyisoprenoid-binding protein YceI